MVLPMPWIYACPFFCVCMKLKGEVEILIKKYIFKVRCWQFVKNSETQMASLYYFVLFYLIFCILLLLLYFFNFIYVYTSYYFCYL